MSITSQSFVVVPSVVVVARLFALVRVGRSVEEGKRTP